MTTVDGVTGLRRSVAPWQLVSWRSHGFVDPPIVEANKDTRAVDIRSAIQYKRRSQLTGARARRA